MYKIYIAGSFGSRRRLRSIKLRLAALGYECTSIWLDDADDLVEASSKMTAAIRDVNDVQRAAALIVDTIDVTSHGGREVEYGIALALGKSLAVVGPKRNVFHELAATKFDGWEECIEWLKLQSR